jgi:hypothetical protein
MDAERELELDLPRKPLPEFDVTLTVPMDSDRDCVMPSHPPLPAGVIGAWCRNQFEAGGALRAADLGEATDLASKAFRQWLALPGAKLVIRPTAPAPVG